MGVNMAGFCISDDEACQDASKQEIIRRYFNSKTRFVREQCKEEEVHKQEMVMKQAGVSEEDRKCVVAARQKEKESHSFSGALELADGTIVTGKTTHLMGACSSVLMNAIKYLAGIEDEALLIEPEAFGPIQKLKTKYLGSVNPRLHTNEILIALSLSAQSNPLAQKAMEQLKQLKGTQAHITCDVAHVDASVYSNLGIQITFEAENIRRSICQNQFHPVVPVLIRVMLKNKKDLHFEQQSKKANEERTSYLYDIFYENVTGTLNMSVVDGEIRIAALNLSMGKVITLENDQNLKKFCRYILEQDGQC